MSEDIKSDQEFFNQIRQYSEVPPASVKEKIDIAINKERRRGFFWLTFFEGGFYSQRLKIAAFIIGILLISTPFYNRVFHAKNGFLKDEIFKSKSSKIPNDVFVIKENKQKEIIDKSVENQNEKDVSLQKKSEVDNSSVVAIKIKQYALAQPSKTINKSKSSAPKKGIVLSDNLNSIDTNLKAEFSNTPPIIHLQNSDEDDSNTGINNASINRCDDESVSVEKQVVEFVYDSTEIFKKPVDTVNLSAMNQDKKSKNKIEYSIGFTAKMFNQLSFYGSNNSTRIDDSSLLAAEDPGLGNCYSFTPSISYGNWIFTFGIGYSKIKEHYKFISFNNILSTTPNSTGNAFNYNDTLFGSYTSDNPVLNFQTPSNSVSTNVISINDSIVENEYNRFEIPLTLGYQLKIYKNFMAGIHTGVAYTYWNKVSGESFNVDKKVISNYDAINEIPVRKSGWDYLVGVELLYAIDKKWSVTIQPSLAFSLKSIYEENYSVSRKLKRQSISFGINFKL